MQSTVQPFRWLGGGIMALLLLAGGPSHATVTPNSLFSDHLVLQQGVAVPVWGKAAEGESVTVSFQDQTVTTKASGGKWLVKLGKLKAGGPYVLTIKGTNTVVVSDVLVGEVWLCSGQSNMARQLGLRKNQQPIKNWEAERDAAVHPQIRFYQVPEKHATEPLEDAGSNWVVCSPQTVEKFSAVGYFFAQALQGKIQVPVGILFSAFGGTPAETWTSRAALESTPELLPLVQRYDRAVHNYPDTLAAFETRKAELLARFVADSARAAQQSLPLPKRPVAPRHPNQGHFIAGLYNGMIKPLEPYALRGACWYQGENNSGRAKQYQALLPALIANWRSDWQLGDFPFLIVQIAPFKNQPPEIREAQLLVSQKVPNTALIVTTDVGDANDIHPADKKPVGQRLAVAAMGLAYQATGEYTAPTYRSMKVKGAVVELTFDHASKGLMAKDGALKGFTIAGPDQQFVPAQAVIEGKTVRVSAPGVVQPVAVRYGWANVPDVNLYSADGLPASIFRTDHSQ